MDLVKSEVVAAKVRSYGSLGVIDATHDASASPRPELTPRTGFFVSLVGPLQIMISQGRETAPARGKLEPHLVCRQAGRSPAQSLICAMGGRFPLYYGVGNGLSWYVNVATRIFPARIGDTFRPLKY